VILGAAKHWWLPAWWIRQRSALERRYLFSVLTVTQCSTLATAIVELQIGRWNPVVVVPDLPVDILLGTDLYRGWIRGIAKVEQGLAVLMRAQWRGGQQPDPDKGSQAAI